MNWLTKLQSKPQKEKVKIVWISVIVTALVLVIVWVFTSKITKQHPDTTLFKTLGQGFKDIKDNFRK